MCESSHADQIFIANAQFKRFIQAKAGDSFLFHCLEAVQKLYMAEGAEERVISQRILLLFISLVETGQNMRPFLRIVVRIFTIKLGFCKIKFHSVRSSIE